MGFTAVYSQNVFQRVREVEVKPHRYAYSSERGSSYLKDIFMGSI